MFKTKLSDIQSWDIKLKVILFSFILFGSFIFCLFIGYFVQMLWNSNANIMDSENLFFGLLVYLLLFGLFRIIMKIIESRWSE